MSRILDRLPVFKRIAKLEAENARLERNISVLSSAVLKFHEYRREQLQREYEHKQRVNANIEKLIDEIGAYMMPPPQIDIDLKPDLDIGAE